MTELNYITPRGLEIIRRELEWLESDERPKVVAEVSYAASLGDRSENAEYIYGKKRLRAIDSRRRFLVKRLDKAELVDPENINGDRVLFGATVEVEDEEGNTKQWRIYGEDEVDISQGILSWRSPLARALMGKTEGASITFQTPSGPRTIELIAVRFEVQEPIPDDLEFGR